MDDLLGDFVAETREMLEALGGQIVVWESNPDDRDRLDAIFRFFHTVKGNCGFFDFPRLQALAHAAEDVLADVRAGRRYADAALVTAVLAVLDRTSDMIEAIDRNEDLGEGDDAPLIRALEARAEAADPGIGSAAVGASARSTGSQRSVRISIELLDRVMSGVSDIVLARNELARKLRDSAGQPGVDASFERLSAMIAEVRDAMTRTRMQPIDGLFATLPRLVRDLSAQLGKQVMIDLDGGDVELDREMIELIRDPLIHLIRNAVDHGIETPAVRRAAGKREIGLLVISARQSGNQILIESADDGRGIDTVRLVDKAVAAGTLTAAEAAQLTPRECAMLICEAGLSTAATVTEVSGRGVGMDVVRANVERIGGSIEVDTTINVGTRITLRVPLTLAITPALVIGAGGQSFAIPRSYIEEIVDPRSQAMELQQVGGGLVAGVRNRRLPVVVLAEVLGIAGAPLDKARTLVVIRLTGGNRYVLAVDRLLDHEELVVKPVAPAVMAAGIYAGSTLCDDGSPLLLLDLTGLARLGGVDLRMHDAAIASPDPIAVVPVQGESLLVFTGCDGKRRAVRMAAAERVETVPSSAVHRDGTTVSVVIGDEILPLAGLGQASVTADTVDLLRLGDGSAQLAYAIASAPEIGTLSDAITRSPAPGEIEGLTLVDGVAVELIDAHWLFAHRAARPRTVPRGVCRLPDGDRWVDSFLRPLVEAAGYRVIGQGDADQADLAIAFEAQAPAAARAAQVLRLCAAPEEVEAGGGAIYRYDRERLTAALAAARPGGHR